MTSAPGPFLTIRAGGPFDGVVTIMVAPDGADALLVEASWERDGEPRSASVTVTGYDAARSLAHEWADRLAAGRDPSRSQDA
jgi:hypothetical protein